MAVLTEDQLLDKYILERYQELNVTPDLREAIRETVGFKIEIIGQQQKELADAMLDSMHKAQTDFIKAFLGPRGDDKL